MVDKFFALDGRPIAPAKVRAQHPHVASIAMSSDPNPEIFAQAMVNGALQFMRKPIVGKEDLAIALRLASDRHKALRQFSTTNKVLQLPPELAEMVPHGIVIAEEHLAVGRGIAQAHSIPLIIYGETGTGKEEIAKLVHRERCRVDGNIPLVVVNCAHLNDDLALSRLFGHKKGAFSGAIETTNGVIGDADGGILFLDELQALSIPVQQKLLRVLNDGSYQRVGETKEVYSNFQLIVVTTKNLDQEVHAGRLLLDLRSRIAGIEIWLPPLRERIDDIPTLVSLALARSGASLGDAQLAELVNQCRSRPWPGNIRQLFRAIETLVFTARFTGREIDPSKLPGFESIASAGGTNKPSEYPTEACYKAVAALEKAFNTTPNLDSVIDVVEMAIIETALLRGPTLSAVGDALGISRSTLDVKRKKYRLYGRE